MTAAARFAAAVSARHRPARNPAAPLSRILRRALEFIAGQHRHVSVTLSPQFQLAFHWTSRSMQLRQRVQRTTASPQSRMASLVQTRTSVREYPAAQTRHQPPRGARASAAVPQSNRSVIRVERIAHADRLPRVLQRTPRVEEKPSRQNDPMIRRAAEPPAALPPAELERVTTHVVRTLDRRMTAWRERNGRI